MHSDNLPPISHVARQRWISAANIVVSHSRVSRLLYALLTLGTMLILKRHYSQATADQLAWILAPTARLVAWLTPAHPVFERGVGHVDFSQGIIIAPACAGINFLIMAFGLAAFCGWRHMDRLKDLVGWLLLCLAGSYVFTLGVNTVRIALSMFLYQADLYNGWLTPARLHRITGVILYLGALWLFNGGATWMLRRCGRPIPGQLPARHHSRPDWLPLAWYLAGTVGVPLVNLLFQPRGSFFIEHCITLIFSSLLVWGVAKLTGRLWPGSPKNQRRCPL